MRLARHPADRWSRPSELVEDDDNHNLDAWESEEAFGAFGQDRLGPAMAAVGVNVEPKVTFYPAHEVFLPTAAVITAD